LGPLLISIEKQWDPLDCTPVVRHETRRHPDVCASVASEPRRTAAPRERRRSRDRNLVPGSAAQTRFSLCMTRTFLGLQPFGESKIALRGPCISNESATNLQAAAAAMHDGISVPPKAPYNQSDSVLDRAAAPPRRRPARAIAPQQKPGRPSGSRAQFAVSHFTILRRPGQSARIKCFFESMACGALRYCAYHPAPMSSPETKKPDRNCVS